MISSKYFQELLSHDTRLVDLILHPVLPSSSCPHPLQMLRLCSGHATTYSMHCTPCTPPVLRTYPKEFYHIPPVNLAAPPFLPLPQQYFPPLSSSLVPHSDSSSVSTHRIQEIEHPQTSTFSISLHARMKTLQTQLDVASLQPARHSSMLTWCVPTGSPRRSGPCARNISVTHKYESLIYMPSTTTNTRQFGVALMAPDSHSSARPRGLGAYHCRTASIENHAASQQTKPSPHDGSHRLQPNSSFTRKSPPAMWKRER
ncbi:hypothetical protein R3P38DRAFT_3538 [Favolaschia claudopus]|uniref:Uncharacterized protein n=1 Tax=Favolaschia claudopus TaxID=2862362 RepID=A0AAW0ECZ6_9AGAR